MNQFYVSGRCDLAPPPPDWRDRLARLLGVRPRRIGTWAELGLYGALLCMADADETSLPHDALVMLTSRQGPREATTVALEQMRTDLPMPLTFLQTQPSQLLALLAAQLGWRGHASFFAAARLPDLLRLASTQSGKAGVLLGCVDETDGGSTHWLRLLQGSAGRQGSLLTLTDWMPVTSAPPEGGEGQGRE